MDKDGSGSLDADELRQVQRAWALSAASDHAAVQAFEGLGVVLGGVSWDKIVEARALQPFSRLATVQWAVAGDGSGWRW